MSTPPGWYKDPERPRHARYWDGDHFVGPTRRCRPRRRRQRTTLRRGLAVATAVVLAVVVLAAVSVT